MGSRSRFERGLMVSGARWSVAVSVWVDACCMGAITGSVWDVTASMWAVASSMWDVTDTAWDVTETV